MRTSKTTISAVINVRNEEENLKKCLKSLKNFATEIIVVDMHSTDSSVQVAQSFGAVVYPFREMTYVEPARNFGLQKATGRWIMLLDPDEYISKELKTELKKVSQRNDIDWVKISRKNYIFGKWIRHANFWPDYLIRFFKRGQVSWKKEIHSQPETKGTGLTLLDTDNLAIRHHNYQSVTDFIIRALRYSNVQADELLASDYKLKTSDFILKPVQEFNSRFFAAEGYKDGLHGLVLCLLQSFTIALIYIRLWEKQGTQDKPLSKDSFVSASQVATYEYSHWFSRYFINEYSPGIIKNILIKTRHFLDRATKNF